jgi:hypothetical protein
MSVAFCWFESSFGVTCCSAIRKTRHKSLWVMTFDKWVCYWRKSFSSSSSRHEKQRRISSPKRTQWCDSVPAATCLAHCVHTTRANCSRLRLRRKRGYLDATTCQKNLFDHPTKYRVAQSRPTLLDTRKSQESLDMKCTSFMYKTSSLLVSCYFWQIDGFKVASFTCNALSSRRLTKLSKSRRNGVWFMIAVSSPVLCRWLLCTPYPVFP